MNLLCPKCETLIEEKYINLPDRTAYCLPCNKHYRISVKIEKYAMPKQEVIEINKLYSRIDVIQNYTGCTIKIKPKGFTTSTKVLLFFAVVWNIITFTVILVSEFWIIYLAPFLLLGLYILYQALFNIFGNIEVNISVYQIEVKWKVLLFSIWDKRKLEDLDQVVRTCIRKKEGIPIFYVTILFFDGRRIRFGSVLTNKEQKWLAREMNRIITRIKSIA